MHFRASLAISVFALATLGLVPSGACKDPPAKSGEPARDQAASDLRLDFDSLASELKKIARDLETSAVEWNRNLPIIVHPAKAADEWQKTALAKVDKLDPVQLEHLARWLVNDNNAAPEVRLYQSAIFKAWASRDFKTAHAYLVALNNRGRSTEKSESDYMQTATFDEVRKVFADVHTGHAMAEPKAAWRDYNSDRSDPTIGKLGAESITASVFGPYAARFPDEAWMLVLTAPKDHDPVSMLKGFVTEAPPGLNWQVKADEFAKSLTDRGISPANWKYRIIVQRWLFEAPEAALEWYASHASSAEVRKVDQSDPYIGFVLPGESPPRNLSQDEAKFLLQLELLDFSNDSHGEDMTPILDRLSEKGYGKLVAAYLKEKIGVVLTPSNGSVLAYIPRLPSQELRHEFFLLAPKRIPIQGDAPFEPARSTRAKAVLNAVRELAGRLELPPDIRELAETTFTRVEAEQKAESLKHQK